MEKKPRAQWGSKLGFILAAAGSAVGLGNIWKFPGKAYECGGGAFMLIYVLAVLVMGFPIMLTELSLGRGTQTNSVDAFKKLNKRFAWIGYVGILAAFIITSYYLHVGGWVLRYVFSYITEPSAVYADPNAYFYNMLGYNTATGDGFMPWTALLFVLIFLACNAVIIIKGVQSGIEKFSKYCMPALLILLIVLLVRTVTLDGAMEGVKYMLTVNLKDINLNTLMVALSQAFYSLSLGMAIMITYGSYLNKKENISKNAALICGMDTLVALIAGFIIVPAVFVTTGAQNVGKGAGFAFVSLAGVFKNMPGGSVFGALFYILLAFAALTSCISLIESLVAFITERVRISRTKCTLLLCAVLFLVGCLYTCSQKAYSIKGIWFDFENMVTTPAFCDFMEFITDRVMVPVCALFTCIFVGWVLKPEYAIKEIETDGIHTFKLKAAYTIIIKYVAPAAIIAILLVSIITGTSLS